jgi:surface protein
LSKWDVSGWYGAYQLFAGCESLEELDLTGWDISNWAEAKALFIDCTALTKINGLEDLEFNNCDITELFKNCRELTGNVILNNITGTEAFTNLAIDSNVEFEVRYYGDISSAKDSSEGIYNILFISLGASTLNLIIGEDANLGEVTGVMQIKSQE